MSQQQAAVRRQMEFPQEEGREGLHILVVEDDAADAHLILRALSEQGAKVAHIDLASDGVEALERLDESVVSPDLAIIDLKMPRMDGFKLLIEMACRGHSNVPVVVLTSSTAKADIVRSLFRGAKEVISKPNTLSDLKRVLATTLAAV